MGVSHLLLNSHFTNAVNTFISIGEDIGEDEKLDSHPSHPHRLTYTSLHIPNTDTHIPDTYTYTQYRSKTHKPPVHTAVTFTTVGSPVANNMEKKRKKLFFGYLTLDSTWYLNTCSRVHDSILMSNLLRIKSYSPSIIDAIIT